MGGLKVEDKPVKVLESLSIEGVVKHLKKLLDSEDKRKVIVMTGAGISTAAGIPDFRSPGTGLYDNLQKYNLPTPQAIFEIGYFQQNPKPFFHLAKELYPALFKPTLCHYFIRLLAEEGLLLRNYTQNIDTLERRAGMKSEDLVEAHGGFNEAHCVTCHAPYSHDFVKERVFRDELVLCTKEGCAKEAEEEGDYYRGLVKPDIVFFGESLPARFGRLATQDLSQCQLLIVMGTSLKVQPFASLVERVPEECPRLLINMEKVGGGNPIMALLGLQAGGMDFDSEDAYRDVFYQGKCDDGCLELAKQLGWEDRLKQLYESEHERLDAEIKELKEKLAPTADESVETKPSE